MVRCILIQLSLVVVLTAEVISAQYGGLGGSVNQVVQQPTYQQPQPTYQQPQQQQQCLPQYITQTEYVPTVTTQVQYQTRTVPQYITQTQTVPQYITQTQTQTVPQYITQTQYFTETRTRTLPAQYITSYNTITQTRTVAQYITSTVPQYNTITQNVPSYVTQTVTLPCKQQQQQRPTGYGSNAGGAALNFVAQVSGGTNANGASGYGSNNVVPGYGK